ncbi:hypothetical protein R3P38DRAFT_3320202 [Favolaschia claudopus]|uniref:Uncharacterized protein n=1 Tax=Favolaschia claudopus TaxID=2862362 RepID=A0AAW0AYX5_9AGAR
MLRSLSLCVIASLCTSVLSKLTNYTIDDTSPAVNYTTNKTWHCDPNIRLPQWTNQTWNNTCTMTLDPFLVSFTGSKVYVFLEATAGVIFNLDGHNVSLWNDPQPSDVIRLAYSNTSMPSGSHTLLISPAHPLILIEFDYLIYTHRRSCFRGHFGYCGVFLQEAESETKRSCSRYSTGRRRHD